MLGRQFTLEKQSIHEVFVSTIKQHNSEVTLPFLNVILFVVNHMKMESRTLVWENFPSNYGNGVEIPRYT